MSTNEIADEAIKTDVGEGHGQKPDQEPRIASIHCVPAVKTSGFLPTDRLLSFRQVQEIVPLSKSRIYELLALAPPAFPVPLKLSSQKVCWIHREILEWLSLKAEKRNGKFSDTVKQG